MELIDTHCHLFLEGSRQYTGGASGMLARAKANGINRVLAIGTNLEDSALNIRASATDPFVVPCIGVHPDSIGQSENDRADQLKAIRKLATDAQVVAIGEVGLDYQAKASPAIQKQFLEELIAIALETQKALIIHMRDAVDDMLELLQAHRRDQLMVVLHCFNAEYQRAKKFWDLGCFTSFTNMIAYPKNSVLQEVVSNAPMRQIMLETDAPFLPPQSRRGSICEASDVIFVADAIARIKNLTIEEIASQTTANATKFFNLKG